MKSEDQEQHKRTRRRNISRNKDGESTGNKNTVGKTQDQSGRITPRKRVRTLAARQDMSLVSRQRHSSAVLRVPLYMSVRVTIRPGITPTPGRCSTKRPSTRLLLQRGTGRKGK